MLYIKKMQKIRQYYIIMYINFKTTTGKLLMFFRMLFWKLIELQYLER